MSDTPKWTPGPWLKVTTGNVGNLIETEDGGIVGHFQAPTWGLDRDEIAQANGNLMAASHELYASLRAMVSRWEPDTAGNDRVMWEEACAALSKAEGRQP